MQLVVSVRSESSLSEFLFLDLRHFSPRYNASRSVNEHAAIGHAP